MISEEILEELNSFFVNNDNNVIDNLDYFLFAGESLLKIIKKLNIDTDMLDKYSEVIDICKIQDVFDFVDKYNKKFNIDLDINKLINDGIIVYDSYQYDELLSDKRKNIIDLRGLCNMDGTTIKIRNNASLNDVIIFIHELSHYKDILNKFNETRFWFTEALAIAEELIATDEMDNFNLKIYNFYDRILFIKKCLNNVTGVLPIMIVYQNFGDTSQESYSKIFEDDLYESDIKNFLNYVNYYLEKKKKFNLDESVFEQLVGELKYVIGFIVAISLYEKYKLDNNYMIDLQNLHKLINELDIYDFLKKLNFDTQVSRVSEILKEYISLFVGCENKKIK